MRVKRYVVDSMPDALQQIRAELGKDAVILNTKEIRSGGFMGWFGKKKIEVVAATDAQPESTTRKSASPPPAERRQPGSPSAMAAQPAIKAYSKAAQVAVLEMPYVPDVLPKEEAPTEGVSAAVTDRAVEPLVETTPSTAHLSSKPAPASSTSAVSGKSKEDLLLEELRQMKDMMNRLAKGSAGARRAPELEELESRLLEQEVHSNLTERILLSVEEQLAQTDEPITAERVRQLARQQLEAIVRLEPDARIRPETTVVHFVGPTGVGKTTTIAKLAAEQVLRERRKVGFITSDTYRIAAIEQLKTYASILNIPIEVVFSPSDLKKAFAQLADRDLIFMDTAGRNYRNELYVSELNALLQTKTNSQTFLVMSMTTKYRDMKAITTNFMNFHIDHVLFTKLDETDSFGPIANLLHDFELKLSYMANGQNVPEDIALADTAFIIDQILGEQGHE